MSLSSSPRPPAWDASTGRRPSPRPTRRRRRRRLVSAVTAAAVSGALALGAAPPASAASPIYLGAVGEVDQLSRQTGTPLAVHAYAHVDQPVPVARMITVKADATWRQVASMQPGSALYSDVVRWARTIASRPGPVFLAYHHEPEASGSSGYGSAAEFIKAYQRVVSVFRAQGAKNVRFTWQMTDWAFRVSPADARSAARWYPGDAYVDVVGVDAFNWSDCGEGRGRWMSLAALVNPALTFARAHGKQASLPEFGADPDPLRAQWLADAHAYLAANNDVVAAAFYFNRGPTNPANLDCSWTLNRSAEFAAFGDMARDRSHFSA
jgi:Glycosyl hydrolase family 26